VNNQNQYGLADMVVSFFFFNGWLTALSVGGTSSVRLVASIEINDFRINPDNLNQF
jgi:hypothetical protein